MFMVICSDERSLFLFNHDNTRVYEVVAFKEPCRSWLIDETVQQG